MPYSFKHRSTTSFKFKEDLIRVWTETNNNRVEYVIMETPTYYYMGAGYVDKKKLLKTMDFYTPDINRSEGKKVVLYDLFHEVTRKASVIDIIYGEIVRSVKYNIIYQIPWEKRD